MGLGSQGEQTGHLVNNKVLPVLNLITIKSTNKLGGLIII